MKYLWILVANALLLAAVNGEPASLGGAVEDSSGADIPHTEVKLTLASGKVEARAVSDANGQFQFANVPSQTYEICFAASGFARLCKPGFQLRQGANRMGRVRLAIGRTSSPTVIGPAPPKSPRHGG